MAEQASQRCPALLRPSINPPSLKDVVLGEQIPNTLHRTSTGLLYHRSGLCRGALASPASHRLLNGLPCYGAGAVCRAQFVVEPNDCLTDVLLLLIRSLCNGFIGLCKEQPALYVDKPFMLHSHPHLVPLR